MSEENRKDIRQRLLQARSEFFHWLISHPVVEWESISPHSGLSIRQLLTCILQRTDLLASMVSGAAKKHSFLNFPQPILRFVEIQACRISARRQTPQSLMDRFQGSLETALILLEDIPEEEWSNGAKILGRYQTVEQVFRDYLVFFQERLDEIRQLL